MIIIFDTIPTNHHLDLRLDEVIDEQIRVDPDQLSNLLGVTRFLILNGCLQYFKFKEALLNFVTLASANNDDLVIFGAPLLEFDLSKVHHHRHQFVHVQLRGNIERVVSEILDLEQS